MSTERILADELHHLQRELRHTQSELRNTEAFLSETLRECQETRQFVRAIRWQAAAAFERSNSPEFRQFVNDIEQFLDPALDQAGQVAS